MSATLAILHLDTCLSDYFQGSSLPVVAVPVTGSDRAFQVRDALRAAFSQLDDVPDLDGVTQADWEAAVDGWFAVRFDGRGGLLRTFAPLAQKAGYYGDGETPYAYFCALLDD